MPMILAEIIRALTVCANGKDIMKVVTFCYNYGPLNIFINEITW